MLPVHRIRPGARPARRVQPNSLRKENIGDTTRASIHVHMNQPFTFKAQSLYGAYAPDAGVCVYGSCFEEAVNGLADELSMRAAAVVAKAEKERNSNGHD